MTLGTMTSNIVLSLLYAKCRVFDIALLSVIVLIVVVLNVVAPTKRFGKFVFQILVNTDPGVVFTTLYFLCNLRISQIS